MYPEGFEVRGREIFMDANATTPVHPELRNVMEHVYQSHYGNPSSPHYAGIRAKRILAEARAEGATLLSCAPESLVFMSGATEGINTAILSVLSQYTAGKGKGKTLLYGATEHKAVPEALKHWNEVLAVGARVEPVAVDELGLIHLDDLAGKLPDALMICTMGANNETGVFQDMGALEEKIRGLRPDIPWMVDCVQMLGKRPVALGRTTIDYAPFSAHKLYGPKGVGALYVRPGARYVPLQIGGGQEAGARGGTENVAGIAALGRIFHWLNHPELGPFHSPNTLYEMRNALLTSLQQAFPKLVLNQPLEVSLPTTLNFSVAGYSSAELIAIFDAAGIRVSAGSACSTGKSRSFVLDAMNLPTWQSEGAIRMSFGPTFTQEELLEVCERLRFIGEQLSRAPLHRDCAFYLPDPFTSNSAWIACPESALVLILELQQKHEEQLKREFPVTQWTHRTWGGSEEDFAGFRITPTAEGFVLRYLKTNRELHVHADGIHQSANTAPVRALTSLEEGDYQFVDVREDVERAMEPPRVAQDKTLSIVRSGWADFLLTRSQDEVKTPVFFCRSGRRARDVATWARVLGWHNAVACDASASEVNHWLARKAKV